jgi:hypothetical protein
LHLPGWLDPWWALEFEITTNMPADDVMSRLTQGAPRLRERPSGPGGLQVVRTGGLMNQFVRAQVGVVAHEGLSLVTVHIRRPGTTAWFLALVPTFMWLLLALDVIDAGIKGGISAVLGLLPLFLIVPMIWAFVIGSNYTSARGEADDLRDLISSALGQPAEGNR